jgi:hypothetical protein
VWARRSRASGLAGPIELRRSGPDRLVLRQRPRPPVRAAVYAWSLVTVILAALAWSTLFRTPTTTFRCDRASGICELDGSSERLPRLDDIRSAELRQHVVHKRGLLHSITLHMRDGSTRDIDPGAAAEPSAVASYRSAVDAINAFLADPSHPRCDISFIRPASTSEKLWRVTETIVALLLLGTAIFLWTTTTATFDRSGTISLATGGPLRRSRRAIPAAEVLAVADRPVARGRALSLHMADRSVVPLFVIASPLPPGDALARELADLIGKPLATDPGADPT